MKAFNDQFLPPDVLDGPLNVVVVRTGARVRIELLRELAATREAMVATHLPFPSVCHVATAGNAFRCVPATWDY